MSSVPESFLLESPARQLGALAANLARLSSSARKPARSATIEPLLDECCLYIESTAPLVAVEIAAELVDLQLMLHLWRRSWPEAQSQTSQRTLLSLQAKKWSDLVLDASGLLESPAPSPQP